LLGIERELMAQMPREAPTASACKTTAAFA
jgi:hypothetical protein